MSTGVDNRLLDPAVLAGMKDVELVARTVVDGFVAGLHRSPDFGFSQEFAEYRLYTPGDDLRHVDWNVFARTEKAFLKRFHGETNSQTAVLLDASGSMGFSYRGLTKLLYAKFVAAALVYLAHLQRDPACFISFHDEVDVVVPPSSRQGQLMRLLHAIDRVQTGTRTDFERPFVYLRNLRRRRGITVLISDFLAPVDLIMKTLEPLHYAGGELLLFHIVDREELEPNLGPDDLLLDMETEEVLEVSPEYARSEYRPKIAAHIAQLRTESQKAGIEYAFLPTDRPLDAALREYFNIRRRRA